MYETMYFTSPQTNTVSNIVSRITFVCYLVVYRRSQIQWIVIVNAQHFFEYACMLRTMKS